MPAAAPDADGGRGTRIRMVGLAVLIAMTAQFYRNAHVVVAPDLIREVGASPQALATLTSALFFASALTQIPGGASMDRFGPRLTICAMLLIGLGGALVFGSARTVDLLVAGRVLMGIGVAILVMAAVVACSRWFKPGHFSLLATGVVGSSHIGALIATAPMALLAERFGWRGAYYGVAVLTLALAVASWHVLRDAPPGHQFHQRKPESLRDMAGGVAEVLRIPGIRPLLAMACSAFATFSCIAGLWGSPYLSEVHGLDTVARGNVLLVMALGLIAGNYAFGFSDRLPGGAKRFIMLGAGLTAVIFGVLAMLPHPGVALVTTLFGLLGLACGYCVLIIVHGRKFYPDRLVGRGITVVNASVLAGAATLQILSGILVGTVSAIPAVGAAGAYRILFAGLAVVLLCALAIYRRCPAIPARAS